MLDLKVSQALFSQSPQPFPLPLTLWYTCRDRENQERSAKQSLRYPLHIYSNFFLFIAPPGHKSVVNLLEIFSSQTVSEAASHSYSQTAADLINEAAIPFLFFNCPSSQCPFLANSDLKHPTVTLETFLCMPCWYPWPSMEKITQK